MKKNKKVLNVLLSMAGLNPKQLFIKEMNKILQEYGESSSVKVRDNALAYLSGKDRELTPTDFKVIDEIIEIGYSKGQTEIRKELLKRRTALYKYYKKNMPQSKAIWLKQLIIPEKPYYEEANKYHIGKAKIKKEDTIGYDLDKEDLRAIEVLTNGDMVYIKEHPQGSPIAKQIKTEMLVGQKANMLGSEIALVLTDQFSQYTPNKFAEHFGEHDYWRGVVANYDTVTKSTVTIFDLDRAGEKTYKWYARMTERTCATCAGLHNRTFLIKGAVDNINNFLDACEEGDIEKMQEANRWVNETEAGELIESDGFFPPAHFRCECWARMDLGYDYK